MSADPIEKELDIFTPAEMREEAIELEKVLKARGWHKLMERYLNYKKVANLDQKGNIRAVIEGKTHLYEKYRAIFDTFKRSKSNNN